MNGKAGLRIAYSNHKSENIDFPKILKNRLGLGKVRLVDRTKKTYLFLLHLQTAKRRTQ